MKKSVLVRKIDSSFKFDDSDIVVQIARIIFRMDQDGDDVFFNVGVKFGFAIDIPFAQSDTEITGIVSVYSNQTENISKQRNQS